MRHTTDQHIKPCNCRSAGECSCNTFAELDALKACIDDFKDHILGKLRLKMIEGKGGWDNPNWPRADILEQLRQHIDKGDMLDVAAFAMFAWNQDKP